MRIGQQCLFTSAFLRMHSRLLACLIAVNTVHAKGFIHAESALGPHAHLDSTPSSSPHFLTFW